MPGVMPFRRQDRRDKPYRSPLSEQRFFRRLDEFLRQHGGDREEGGHVLEAIVVDRMTHERMHFVPMPYGHKTPPGKSKQEVLVERVRIAMRNVDLAAEALRNAVADFDEFDRQQQESKGDGDTAASRT